MPMVLYFSKDINYPFFNAYTLVSRREIEIKSNDYFIFVEAFTNWKRKNKNTRGMYFFINIEK